MFVSKIIKYSGIIDYNKLQSISSTSNTLELELVSKFKSFGWDVVETDGHNHESLIKSTNQQNQLSPTVILCHTVKGKGVGSWRIQTWHYRSPKNEEYIKAKNELKKKNEKFLN